MTEAFLTAIGFPTTLEGLYDMVLKHQHRFDPERDRAPVTDLDYLLEFSPEVVEWSSPPWAKPGDVAMFYCTARSKRSVAKLRKELASADIGVEDGDAKDVSEVRVTLNAILDLADRQLADRAGTMAVIGQVATLPFYGEGGGHFRDRTFAKIVDIQPLHTPINPKALTVGFKVRPAATITRVPAAVFEAIKEQHHSDLPGWFNNTRVGLEGFPGMTWRDAALSENYRARTEDEFREFVLTPMLQEIADEGAEVMSEFRTYRRGKSTGIIDNCVKVDGRWLGIEAKLRIPSERYIVRQAQKYIGCAEARGTEHVDKGKQVALTKLSTCPVFDMNGFYAVSRNGFDRCSPASPKLDWKSIVEMSTSQLRTWFQAM